MRSTEWMSDAACSDVDVEIMFPDRRGDASPAKLVCGRCPVRVQCLEFALSFPDFEDSVGVYGGLTARERRRVRGRRRCAA